MPLRLYFSPGACSLSPHIALREAELPFELEQVDLKAKKTKSGDDYLSINPKGYVPALRLDDGEVVTEGAIIVQYIADQKPNSQLAPPPGTRERRQLNQWLHFIATELQKGLGPLNNPKANDEFRQVLRAKVDSRFAFLAKSLQNQPYLLGENFSVADGYAYYTLRSLRKLDAAALANDPVLKPYFDRIEARPAVQAALRAEGLS